MNRIKHRGRSVQWLWKLTRWCVVSSWALSAGLGAGCGKVGHGDSESHFLTPCERDEDCTDLGDSYTCKDGFCRIHSAALVGEAGSGGTASGSGGESTTLVTGGAPDGGGVPGSAGAAEGGDASSVRSAAEPPPVAGAGGAGEEPPSLPTYCLHGGVRYALGERFAALDGCGSCECTWGGRARCDAVECGCVIPNTLHEIGEPVIYAVSQPSGGAGGEGGANGYVCTTAICAGNNVVNGEIAECEPADGCFYGRWALWYPEGITFEAEDGCNTCTCQDGEAVCTTASCCDPAREWWRRYDEHGEITCEGDAQRFENACGAGCEQNLECPEWLGCSFDEPGLCEASALEHCPYSTLGAPPGPGPAGAAVLCEFLTGNPVVYDPSCLACTDAACCYELSDCQQDPTCYDYGQCVIECQQTRDPATTSLEQCLDATCPDLVEAAETNPAVQKQRACAAENCPGVCQSGTL